MIFAYNPMLFVIMLVYELIIVWVTNYLCFVPLTASIIFPVVHICYTGDMVGTLIICVATIVMLYKHMENLNRIKNGIEVHFSFLWNKDKEIERLQKNLNE